MRTILILITFLVSSHLVHSETIQLKNGKIIDATILERTEEYVRVDISGISIKYYSEEIESIDGVTLKKARKITPLPQTTTDDIDIERIRRILKKLQYPEHTWPGIERELVAFLIEINFPQLKEKAKRAKSNPIQLKEFASEIGKLMKQKGYLNPKSPHNLTKLLVNSFGKEDIFNVIDLSPITKDQKEESKQSIVACSLSAQVGTIILDLLDISSKTVVSTNHVFNCIPLDDQKFIFVDFINQIFDIVDINKYYESVSEYLVMKKEYRSSLNYLYYHIYITDTYGATFAIYNNRGLRYYDKGDSEQAIANFNQALKINLNYALAYYNRGKAFSEKGDFNQAIEDYNQSVRFDPNYADTYNNRAVAYFFVDDYSRAWEDVNKVKALGEDIHPDFLQELRKASGRDY